MKKQSVKSFLWVGLLSLLVMGGFFESCGSSSSTNIISDSSQISSKPSGTSKFSVAPSSDVMTIKVLGANTDNCTVTGEYGRTLGSGPSSAVTYQVGMERAGIVRCGSQAAVFGVGDGSVTLTSTSTLAANKLSNTAMGPGTLLLATTLTKMLTNSSATSSSISVGKSLSGAKATAQAACNTTSTDPASNSLAEIATALSVIQNPADTASLKTAIIQILVNSGEAVVIENVGQGQTMSDCSDATATAFSSMAKTTNASVVGMTGCLVYHCLDAVSDLNNPLGAPANNIPASFRSVMKESTSIQQLINSFVDNRYFDISSVNNYLYTQIGYTGYTEDEEGVTTNATISASDMTTTLTPLITSTKTNADLLGYKFHTGYNPSGGWEINAAAAKQSLPTACTDSDKTTSCSVSPLKFDFDGTTLTQNSSGGYILEMQFANGAFTNKAYVINATTSLPYRDSLYQPVQVSIDPTTYSAIDYANPLYQATLNPMQDSSSNSAPFSNAAWRTKYPNMKTLLNNNYQFPTIEVAAREIAVINQHTNLSQLPALQAYMISKLMVRGMAAFSKGSAFVHSNEHTKTVSNWESTTNTWLASGTPASQITGGGGVHIENGALTISSASCKTSAGATVSCTVTSALQLDQNGSQNGNQNGQNGNQSGGNQFNVTSGTLVVNSTPIGTVSYTPTYLLIANDDKSAQLLGNLNLTFSFTGSGLTNKISNGKKLDATYSMTAIGN